MPMANIKLERALHFGVPYTPDMQSGDKRPEPTWSTLREQGAREHRKAQGGR